MGLGGKLSLLKVAICVFLVHFYWDPMVLMEETAFSNAKKNLKQIQFVRTILAFTLTILAFFSTITIPLVIVCCFQCALNLIVVPHQVTTGFQNTCWTSFDFENMLDLATGSCLLEYLSVISFVLQLKYVFFPPRTMIASYRRHRTQMRKFFAKHDQKYVPLVENLLSEYIGNERLLFTRLRRMYLSSPRNNLGDRQQQQQQQNKEEGQDKQVSSSSNVNE